MNTNKTTDALLPPPLMPRFGLGDIVEVLDYVEWRGEKLMIVEVRYDPKTDILTYSTVPAYAPTSEGMTTDWPETSLTLYQTNKFNTRAQPNPAQGVDYIRKDIVPQDQVRAALSGLDGLMGATFWNTNEAKHEWSEWANKNRDILRALLVAHGGNK